MSEFEYVDGTVEYVTPDGQNYVGYLDDPDKVQYLIGDEDAGDAYLVDANRDEFELSLTRDADGIVLWNEDNHDVLYDFELIVFNDETVDISELTDELSQDSEDETDPELEEEQDNDDVDEDDDIDEDDDTDDDEGDDPSDDEDEEDDTDEDDNADDDGEDTDEYEDIPGETQFVFADETTSTFVIDADAAGYSWAPTEDGLGIVVWGPNGHDLLYGIETIQFSDQAVSLIQEGDEVEDVAFASQHLVASGDDQAFVIDGNSDDYGYGPTEDGTGIVVWGETGFDLLYGFSKIVFNDAEIDLSDIELIDADDLEDEDAPDEDDSDFIGFDGEDSPVDLDESFDEDDGEFEADDADF
ncbi:MAG: hypothetical protein ABJM29_16440 [Rhizobiaceae bacterium]